MRKRRGGMQACMKWLYKRKGKGRMAREGQENFRAGGTGQECLKKEE